MKQEVTIDEIEVNQAILDYAEKHGVKLENASTKVTVVASRGDRGVYATIAIEPNILKNIIDGSKQALTSNNIIDEEKEERSIQNGKDESVPVEIELVGADVDAEDSIFG